MDNSKSKENVLIIFMKSPHPGKVKTRLQPEISAEVSLSLYKAMGKDLIDHFSQSQIYDLYIEYWPEDALGEMRSWLGGSLNYIPQRGLDLGEKLKNSFSNAFRKHYQKVCIIGSDLPTLGEKDILGAFKKLHSSDVVLGPVIDGGYYLVALKKFYPHIFENIDWSTESVLRQTLHKIEQQNLSVAQLAVQQDIDNYQDIMYFWNKILENENELGKEIPNTFAALRDFFGKVK